MTQRDQNGDEQLRSSDNHGEMSHGPDLIAPAHQWTMCDEWFNAFGLLFGDLHRRNPSDYQHQAITKQENSESVQLRSNLF